MTKESRKKGVEPDETRRSSGLYSFGADVRKLIAPLLGKKGLMQADILAEWKNIVGEDLASGASPFSLSFSKQREGAVLTVKTFSGAFAVELTARKEQIIERINSYFGYAAVGDIKVVQGGTFTPPVKKEPPPQIPEERMDEIRALTAGIEDDSLREALTSLGMAISVPKKD